MQIAELNRGYDEVVIRYDRENSRSFAVFYLKNSKLIAADCVNRPQEFMISKRLIPQQTFVAAKDFANEGFNLKGLL